MGVWPEGLEAGEGVGVRHPPPEGAVVEVPALPPPGAHPLGPVGIGRVMGTTCEDPSAGEGMEIGHLLGP